MVSSYFITNDNKITDVFVEKSYLPSLSSTVAVQEVAGDSPKLLALPRDISIFAQNCVIHLQTKPR